MDIRTDDLRVVDLADEFGITISETLALCKRFDIPAPYGSSIVTAPAATLLRGLATGEISPDSVDTDTVAAHRAPAFTAADEVEPNTNIESGLDDFDHLRGQQELRDDGSDSTQSGDDSATDSAADSDSTQSPGDSADDYDYGDLEDYDSYGVAGLDALLTAPKPDVATPVPVAGVAPDSSAAVRSVSLPTTPAAPTGQSTGEQTAEPSDSTKPSGVNVSATRSALRERGPERRTNGGRRPGDRNGGNTGDAERAEYDPNKLRAEYDDIDKYVPRWLKFIALGALAVFGFLFYQLFFGGSAEVVENGPQQTPIYSAGDCFDADIALWIDTMTSASCGGEHDGEVFYSVTLTGEPGVAYPDPATMTSQARQSCRAPFSQYTGQSSFVSDYQIGVSLPTSIEWARGDRIAYCSTISGDGTKLTGSTAKA